MNRRTKAAIALATVSSITLSALILVLPSGAVGGRLSTLEYALTPYHIKGATLLGAAFASGVVVAGLKKAWTIVFNGSPKLLLGFYKGGDYVLVVAGNAQLVVRKCGSSTYEIELLAAKVALTYTSAGDGDALKLLKKLDLSKLLKVLKPPVRTFSNVLIYEGLKLTSRVKVDSKGFMYLGSTFLGTWPFRLPRDGRILWVVPRVYCSNLGNATGVVLTYRTVRRGNIVLAIPNATASAGGAARQYRIAGVEAPRATFIEVGGRRYVVVAEVSPALTPYVMGYDPSSGVLKWVNISRSAVRADGWRIPVMYFSLMLPAPIPMALGPNAYIVVVPLGGYNAVKLVLKGAA